MAPRAGAVVGIESVPEAIEDAKVNSRINNIGNTRFFAGDMKDIFSDSFIKEQGKPDVIITDPPRAGMHPKVVDQILKIAPHASYMYPAILPHRPGMWSYWEMPTG